MDGLGAGLAAFAFWGFIASTVIGGIWYAIREKEAQHETLRRMIDSGQELDEVTVSRIFKDNSRPDQDLKVGGLITLFCAPGLLVLGWFIGRFSQEAFLVLTGVSGLVAFVGLGLLVAARSAAKHYQEEGGPTLR